MYYIETKKRINSRKYSPIEQYKTEQEVIDYVRHTGDKYAGTPYIFTHINLASGDIITQKDDRFGLICSPVKLNELFKTNQ